MEPLQNGRFMTLNRAERTQVEPNSVIRRFFVADLDLRGDLKATAEYRYEQLEQIPGAAELIIQFSTHLYRTPEEFEIPLDRRKPHLIYRWRASSETSGIATLRDGG